MDKLFTNLTRCSSQTQTVNARDLHAALGSKKQFANWIKARIHKYGFKPGADYTILKTVKNSEITDKKPYRGRPSTDYHITLRMAKELAMVESTEAGRLVRRYFLECEKIARKETPGDFLRIGAAELRDLLQEIGCGSASEPPGLD